MKIYKIILLSVLISIVLISSTIAKGITSITHNAYHSLQSGSRNDEVPLPQGLHRLGHHIHVHHFKANQQDGNTCGNHAIYNALAVQELLEENRQLTPHNVRERAKLYFPNMMHKDYKLESNDIDQLGVTLGLKNTQIVGFAPSVHQFSSGGSINANEDYDDFIQEIRNAQSTLAHFILNYSDHWVTVSVIKHNKHIRIIYHNSTNAPIIKDGEVFHFITELCGRLI